MSQRNIATQMPEYNKDIEFYEVMQAGLRQPYIGPVTEQYGSDHVDMGRPVGRLTAIITLLGLVVAVGVLSFIVVEGIRVASR